MKAGLGIWLLNGLETIVNNSLYGSEQNTPAGTNEKPFVYTTVRLTLAGKLYVVCVAVFFNAHVFQFLLIQNIRADNNSVNFDKKRLEGLVAGYINWNVDVPTDQLPEEGNQCVMR